MPRVGFYWLVAYHPTRPGIIEIRLGEYSERKWVTSPGEYHLAYSGEFGGLMHNTGRTPHRLVGVGFDAQGFDHGSGYRRRAGSHDRRAAFIFEGVDDEVIGDFGPSPETVRRARRSTASVTASGRPGTRYCSPLCSTTAACSGRRISGSAKRLPWKGRASTPR